MDQKMKSTVKLCVIQRKAALFSINIHAVKQTLFYKMDTFPSGIPSMGFFLCSLEISLQELRFSVPILLTLYNFNCK